MIDLLQSFNPLDFMSVGLGDWIDQGWDWLTNTTGLKDEYNGTGKAINQFMVDLCNKDLLSYGVSMSNHLVGTARALGAIFAICVAASRAYKVMAEGDRFNVLSVMRPLIFAFVLSIWPAICSTLMMPGRYVENYMRSQYVVVAEKMDELREQRKNKAYEVNEYVLQMKTSADGIKEDKNAFREFFDTAKNVLSNPGAYLANITASLQIWVCNVAEHIIQGIGEMVFAVCVYIVFLCKALYLTVLMMFGPVYMVCSILDVWKNSWTDWVGRMVSVSMFGAMAYLVMTFACVLIIFTIQADITKLNQIAANPEIGMATYIKSGFGTTIMTFVGYLVGAVAMGTVYELASFTFPGGAMMGASSFIGGMKGYATKYTGTKAVFNK